MVYNDNVDDIDLYVGGVSEVFLLGSILGGIFFCIFIRGFENFCVGDWFWYERNDFYIGFIIG